GAKPVPPRGGEKPGEPGERAEPRLDVKRALRVEQPAKRFPQKARRRERRGEAGRQPARVAVRAAVADLAAVDDDDPRPATRELEGARGPDHTGPHDQDPGSRQRYRPIVDEIPPDE